ncbi:precorrin-6A synthase (deacetylating) [Streptomyces sp. NPDC058953]|uniref:precorrin-6A synthase (deacetylating) n=1 Tax=unclassified Streptomyces TaxID=2593676 RepID=UPI0036B1DF3E
MRTMMVIGIGAGDPEDLTLRAVKALKAADAFLVLDKGERAAEQTEARRRLLDVHREPGSYRLVVVADPERDRRAADYPAAVADWRSRRAEPYERFIADELGDDECGAVLVWGDPALYDSALGVLEEVRERGTVDFDVEVVPGVSSVSALLARHRTGLNRVGRPVLITTGRRLAEGWPEGVDDVVVMLGSEPLFTGGLDPDTSVHWGAYVGTGDEILVAGRLGDVAERIARLRAEARERKGWIMDVCLLRRN